MSWSFANKKSKNEDDLINEELEDLKRRRNLCEEDLRPLQRKLNSLQDELGSLQKQLLDFQLAGDETKARILQQAVAEKKAEIAEEELRPLQRELNSLQKQLLDFQLAGDESKARILKQAVAEKKAEIVEQKGEIAEMKVEIVEKEAVLAKTPQEKDEWKQRVLAARQEQLQLREDIRLRKQTISSKPSQRINPLVEIKAQVKALVGSLPKLEELTAVITTENFPIKIPAETLIMKNIVSKAIAQNPNWDLDYNNWSIGCLELSETHSIIEFYPVLYVISQTLGSFSHVSEDMFRSTFDALLGWPIKHLLSPVIVNLGRNSEEVSNLWLTKRNTRPDFLLSVKEVLLLRGEEKADGKSIEKPAEELVRKIRNWNPAVYGRLPYVFGFASAGYKFRLYALHPQPGTLEVLKTQIGRELNLALVMDALQLVQWVFYLARLIDLLSEEIEDDAPPIGTPWKRKSGRNSIITIHDDYVEKQLVSDKEYR